MPTEPPGNDPAKQPAIPVAAPLENPFYYLENVDTVVRWILKQHGDLLLEEEITALTNYLSLPNQPRALLVRLITRTRDLFRTRLLSYPEITGELEPLTNLLAGESWLEVHPHVSVADLCRLFRKEEIFLFFQHELVAAGLKKSSRKADMAAELSDTYGTEQKPLQAWSEHGTETVVSVATMPLFERIRLMFFGNLHQTWSEFVVTELGYLRYESVPFTKNSRAFQSREEVDNYLNLHDIGQRLDEEESPETLWQATPKDPVANPWLENRRRRLVFRLGHQAERNKNIELARQAYLCAWNEDSRIRYFRMMEKHAGTDEFFDSLIESLRQCEPESEQQLLTRIIRRIDKTHPLANAFSLNGGWSVDTISLIKSSTQSVEELAAHHYSVDNGLCFYVENSLFNSLLGLLFWPAVYAPVPGAFFHPFQSGPADLFREDFMSRRQNLCNTCMEDLETDQYKVRIRHNWNNKLGISCPLVNWQLLSKDLLELSLSCIPASHLKFIFQRLLSDLRRHRSGLPDLIRFWPGEGRYELIEVKGPGDRLQDHQKLWLDYFVKHGIPARVCQVAWGESP